MKFLIDAHLPPVLADLLTAAGHDAIHTLNLPNQNFTKDRQICAVADAEGRIVVSKDADFVTSFYAVGSPKKLLLVSTGNISNKRLRTLFFSHLGNIVAAFVSHQYVELSRVALIIHA